MFGIIKFVGNRLSSRGNTHQQLSHCIIFLFVCFFYRKTISDKYQYDELTNRAIADIDIVGASLAKRTRKRKALDALMRQQYYFLTKRQNVGHINVSYSGPTSSSILYLCDF